jgi:hypothetical protein
MPPGRAVLPVSNKKYYLSLCDVYYLYSLPNDSLVHAISEDEDYTSSTNERFTTKKNKFGNASDFFRIVEKQQVPNLCEDLKMHSLFLYGQKSLYLL